MIQLSQRWEMTAVEMVVMSQWNTVVSEKQCSKDTANLHSTGWRQKGDQEDTEGRGGWSVDSTAQRLATCSSSQEPSVTIRSHKAAGTWDTLELCWGAKARKGHRQPWCSVTIHCSSETGPEGRELSQSYP